MSAMIVSMTGRAECHMGDRINMGNFAAEQSQHSQHDTISIRGK
jgi:hypothetical protein